MFDNTVLITGGTSGIGLELAKRLLAKRNTVIITGRNQENLDRVSLELPGVVTLRSDSGAPNEIRQLQKTVVSTFPALNMLIANAGMMHKIDLACHEGGLEELTREIDVNLSGLIQTTSLFLPHLKSQPNAAIVTVSSGLAFVPYAIAPVYSASKAGVHAFTRSLRAQLSNTRVKVFELAPPAVKTPLTDAFEEEMSGLKLMTVDRLADEAIKSFERDRLEIRPGLANALMLMSRACPSFIFKQINRSIDTLPSRKG